MAVFGALGAWELIFSKSVDKSILLCYNGFSVDKSTYFLLARHDILWRKESKLETVRFEKFTLLIDGIHKSINKIKHKIVPTLGIKSVHVLWLYQLMQHPEGLTAAEIAAASMIDRSLVSREIESLMSDGCIARTKSRRFTLTERGIELAKTIEEMVKEGQAEADEGISEEELLLFYRVLEKLHENFARMSEKRKPKRKSATNKE